MLNIILILLFSLSLTSKDLITTSSYPLSLISKEIVGNIFETSSILGAGVPSKDYKQNPSIIYQSQKSKVLLYSSNKNENWVLDLPVKIKINLTDLISDEDKIFLEDNDAEDYFWMDPKTTSVVVESLADTLGKIFPDKAGDLKTNAGKFLEKLEIIDAMIEKGLLNTSRVPMLQEDATMIYFASAYDFPIPFTLNEVPEEDLDFEISNLADTGVSQLLLNEYSKNDEQYKAIIDKYHLDVSYVNVYGYANKNYYDMMQEIAKIIKVLYR